jgi:phosphonate transport system substrate-binding protein
MRILFGFKLLAILALVSSPIFADEKFGTKPVEIGIVPYMSVRELITKYEPLRIYLEHALGTPVKIYTANGFRPFYLNTEKGDYDLAITPSHIARLLQNEHGFTPLVRFSTPGRVLLMSAFNSPLKTVQELNGRVIAVPDKFALASIACMAYLSENELLPGKNFKLLEVPSFPSAIISVQKGDAAAACTASPPFSYMPRDLQDSVQILADMGTISGLVVLARPGMKKLALNKLVQTLLKINDHPNGGKQFITSLGFGPLIPVTSKDMSSLDRYLAETKRLMRETP